MKQINTQLPKYEIRFYIFVWVASILYSLYNVYLAGNYFFRHQDFEVLSRGWFWLGRRRDNSDYEWNVWMDTMKQLLPWIFMNLVVSQYLKSMKISKTIICSWYVLITGVFLWNSCGFTGILYFLVSPCLICILTLLRSKLLVYVVHVAILIVSQFYDAAYFFNDAEVIRQYLLNIVFFWLQLRSIDCSLDNIDNYKHENFMGFLKNVIQCTAYCWYLSNFFFGPHILYHKFLKGLNEPVENLSRGRIMQLLNLLRYAFWMLFTEVMYHFLYSGVFALHPYFLAKVDKWAYYGVAYSIAQFFCNKYIVFYGISGEISRMDNIDAPPPPKCVGRIHLCPDTWRFFDRGLYEFLVRCIYVPICSFNIPLKKVIGSFATFSFIFLWHGAFKVVFIWSMLNYVGVFITSMAESFGNSKVYRRWQQRYLSLENSRRFNCILATPLFALSIVSNLYFIGGEEVGNLYMYRLFYDSPTAIISFMFVLYCGCQTSTEMKSIENHRKEQRNKVVEKKLF